MTPLESFNQFYNTLIQKYESPTVAQTQAAVIEALLRTYDVTGKDEVLPAQDIFNLLADITAS